MIHNVGIPFLEYQGISLIKKHTSAYICLSICQSSSCPLFAHLSRRQLPKFLRGRLHLQQMWSSSTWWKDCHVSAWNGKNMVTITLDSQVAKSCTKVAVAIRNTKKLKSNSWQQLLSKLYHMYYALTMELGLFMVQFLELHGIAPSLRLWASFSMTKMGAPNNNSLWNLPKFQKFMQQTGEHATSYRRTNK